MSDTSETADKSYSASVEVWNEHATAYDAERTRFKSERDGLSAQSEGQVIGRLAMRREMLKDFQAALMTDSAVANGELLVRLLEDNG